MTLRRSIIAAIFVICLAAFAYLVSPWFGAFVWSHRVSRSVKVQTNYPGCVPGKEPPESFRCECEIVFGGVVDPASLSFEGDLRKSFDATTRTFTVSGTGRIHEKTNEVDISADHIVINKTELPRDKPSSFHVFIDPDGSLKNSRVDISW